MTDKQKAEEIASKIIAIDEPITHSTLINALMMMAQWKDEQFEKKLQEIVDYVYPLICGGERLHINEIIGKDMKWKYK